MPAKKMKLAGGRIVEIKSILLPSGNLLIPARDEADRNHMVWKEVEPGTSLHKRWWPVREPGPDPRHTRGPA